MECASTAPVNEKPYNILTAHAAMDHGARRRFSPLPSPDLPPAERTLKAQALNIAQRIV